ncbi:hypothetical protein Hanom_Chr08g00686591 [Helianthus anomalus]
MNCLFIVSLMVYPEMLPAFSSAFLHDSTVCLFSFSCLVNASSYFNLSFLTSEGST